MKEDFKYHKWATFTKEAGGFSDSFRQVMASQLEEKFYLMLEVTQEKIKRPKFQLTVGLLPMKTIYKDGYAFALVYITDPVAFATPVTAYWRPLENVNVESATELDIWDNENIEFGWCTDFNVENYMPYLKPRNIYPKQQTGTSFLIEYDYTLYPDLTLIICCSEKIPEGEIEEIEKILSASIKDTYISELTTDEDEKESDNNNEIIAVLDFEDNDFEVSKQQILDAFQKIGQSPFANKIERVIIE